MTNESRAGSPYQDQQPTQAYLPMPTRLGIAQALIRIDAEEDLAGKEHRSSPLANRVSGLTTELQSILNAARIQIDQMTATATTTLPENSLIRQSIERPRAYIVEDNHVAPNIAGRIVVNMLTRYNRLIETGEVGQETIVNPALIRDGSIRVENQRAYLQQTIITLRESGGAGLQTILDSFIPLRDINVWPTAMQAEIQEQLTRVANRARHLEDVEGRNGVIPGYFTLRNEQLGIPEEEVAGARRAEVDLAFLRQHPHERTQVGMVDRIIDNIIAYTHDHDRQSQVLVNAVADLLRRGDIDIIRAGVIFRRVRNNVTETAADEEQVDMYQHNLYELARIQAARRGIRQVEQAMAAR